MVKITKAFRLNEKHIAELEKLAKKEGETVSFLIQQAMMRNTLKKKGGEIMRCISPVQHKNGKTKVFVADGLKAFLCHDGRGSLHCGTVAENRYRAFLDSIPIAFRRL